VWRISIFEGKEFRQHLLDFFLLRRQFVVDIAEAPAGAPSSTKRLASGDDEVTIKRQRLWKGDVSEILLAPTTDRPQEPPGAIGTPNALAARTPGTLVATPSQQISHPSNTIALLHLLDGEVAIVRTATQPRNPDIDPPEAYGQTTARVSSPATYELQRIGGIANTMSSSVFVGRHSELSDNIVAKVIRYNNNPASDLLRCASKWQAEKGLLEKLRHGSLPLPIIFYRNLTL
jgi:hypothetical protein